MRYHRDDKVGLFSADERLSELEKLGDPLLALSDHVDFEFFRATLEEVLYGDYDRAKGGRPPFDVVMMLKVLVLQRFYALSDDAVEFQIKDRLSFQRFLGLDFAGRVPDAKTVWVFREALRKEDLVKRLFDEINARLVDSNVIATAGQIVDASFVQAPRQRNTREENKVIKDGGIPPGWQETPSRLCQKDLDARWAKKNDEVHYGYKDHIMVDRKSKIVTDYVVTDASVHDSQELDALTALGIAEDQELYADSAYRSAESEELLASRGIFSKVHFKAYRNRPLTAKEKRSNKARSKQRARVEHVFGFMTNSMGGMRVRCCSVERNEVVIGLMNLTYNLFRLKQLNRKLERYPA